MYASILFERGVSDSHIDAAKLAYEALARVKGEAPSFAIRPLQLELALLPSGQIDSSFVDSVMPDQDVSALFVTANDLGAPGLNFCFGRSAFNQRAAVVSASRVGDATMFGLAIHELGHSEGLVAECAPQYDSLSRFAGHCANTCVMEPVNNLTQMNATVDKFMASPRTSGFCEPCAVDLNS